MKKKVSRELQALEKRIKNLKETVNSKKGNLGYHWEKITNSAKASKEFRLKGGGSFSKDSL